MSIEETKQRRWNARMMARYQRQMVLPQVGFSGQERLLESRVLIVGVGALGSAASAYLAAAGVGTIGLVDGDTVDLSNLHRQILHDESQVGAPKTRSGASRLRTLNPDVQVVEHHEFLTSKNALAIFSDYDIIVNGSDNFPTRYLVNDAAVLLGKPLVDAAILRFEGQLAVYRPAHGCYRCLFPTPPSPGSVPNCAEAGILGAVAGVLGSMEAVETLKLLLGLEPNEQSHLSVYDALRGNWQRMPFRRNRACVVCGDRPTVTTLIDYDSFCGSESLLNAQAGADTAQPFSVNVDEVARMINGAGIQVIDIRNIEEYTRGHIPEASYCSMEELDSMARTIGAKPMLLVCQIGVRSSYAAQYLRSLGYTAWTLSGGTSAWEASGRPLVSP